MEPVDVFVGAKPGELALGEVAVIALHEGEGFLQTDGAAQIEAHAPPRRDHVIKEMTFDPFYSQVI